MYIMYVATTFENEIFFACFFFLFCEAVFMVAIKYNNLYRVVDSN